MFNAFMLVVKQYTLKGVAGLGGLKAWAAKLIVKYVMSLLEKLGRLLIEKAQAKKELKEYEKEIAKPDLTADERRKADGDFLK